MLQELGHCSVGATRPGQPERDVRWLREGNESLHLRPSLPARPLLSDDGHALRSVVGSRHASRT